MEMSLRYAKFFKNFSFTLFFSTYIWVEGFEGSKRKKKKLWENKKLPKAYTVAFLSCFLASMTWKSRRKLRLEETSTEEPKIYLDVCLKNIIISFHYFYLITNINNKKRFLSLFGWGWEGTRRQTKNKKTPRRSEFYFSGRQNKFKN